MLTDVVDTIETVAEADFVGTATDVALTVTCGVAGMTDGAVYKPAEVIVPHAAATHRTPETVHVTAVLEVPETPAENCCCPLWAIVAEAGDIVTPTAVGVPIVTVARPI